MVMKIALCFFFCIVLCNCTPQPPQVVLPVVPVVTDSMRWQKEINLCAYYADQSLSQLRLGFRKKSESCQDSMRFHCAAADRIAAKLVNR